MKRSQIAVPSAAACLALLFSGCSNASSDAELAGSTDPSSESAAPSPSVSAMSTEEAAALAVVNEAYAAFNSGDAARWTEMRAGSYDPASGSKADYDANLADETQMFQERMDAGVQFTEIECESHGEGEWPGFVDPGLPEAQGYHFSCEHSDGGGTHVTHWVIADGKVVAAGSN